MRSFFPTTPRGELVRVFLLTLASLFAVPAATLVFTEHARRTEDASFLEQVEARAADRPDATAFYRSHPLSSACTADGPEERTFHERACPTWGFRWQFHWAERLAVGTLAFGAALLLAALGLGALAFVNRGLRVASFVFGWRLMTVSSALEVLAQGAMVTWLAFWVTAYFWERVSVKLVAIAGIVAAAAVALAVWTIFRRLADTFEIEGEPLAEADAPRLWTRVRELAARLGTAPPDRIVAGIDANFFVTESPAVVAGASVSGRTLFVSIPLLRVLETDEADAVLAHELAHLGGGDTGSSAALGPKLQQFDAYTWKMRTGGLTIVVHWLLRLYRTIFEFALARDSRERETLADRTAARATSAGAIARSLVKIAAYASYRGAVERRLFEHDREHVGRLGIAGAIAAGLVPYARSPEFLEAMETAAVPHPFDRHPRLADRMRAVQHVLEPSAWGETVTRAPTSTWADDIATAEAIEERLWGAYEERFAADHDLSLAYRYEPATEAERALVLRHFPPLDFALGPDERIGVDIEGIRTSGGEPAPVRWDEIKAISFEDGRFSPALVVTHHEKKLLVPKSSRFKLKGLDKAEREPLRAAVGRYWHRHQAMRAGQQPPPTGLTPPATAAP